MAMLLNRTGEQALPFSFLDEKGNPAGLGDFRGRWLLLVFHRHLA
jgi:hypothetical protein